jgi:hypothetical protein
MGSSYYSKYYGACNEMIHSEPTSGPVLDVDSDSSRLICWPYRHGWHCRTQKQTKISKQSAYFRYQRYVGFLLRDRGVMSREEHQHANST